MLETLFGANGSEGICLKEEFLRNKGEHADRLLGLEENAQVERCRSNFSYEGGGEWETYLLLV